MKNNYVLMGILVVSSVVIPYLYQNHIRNKLLRELYSYKINKQQKEFFELLDSFQSKFCLSTFTILFMKFNYYMDSNEYDKAKILYKEIEKQKMNNQNEVALKLKMFYSSVEKKDYEMAKNIKNSLMLALSKYKGKDSETIKGEVEQIDKIYLQKDVSILPELVEAFDNADEDAIKGLLCFRIAKLYHVINDEDSVNKYLNLAKHYTLNENAKKSLDHIIRNHGELI